MGMMINRRRVCGGKKLPYDAEIEYLESTGTQRIDTNIYPKNGYEFTIKYSGYTIPSSNSEHILFIAGVSWNICVGINNSRNGQRSNTIPYVSYDGVSCPLPQQTEAEFTLNDSGLFFNGNMVYVKNANSYDFTQYIGNKAYQISLLYPFRPWDGSQQKTSCKLEGFSAKYNGAYVINMIPVRVGTIGYMYDKVSGQLFGNAGTGNFILGPDK